MEEENGEEKKGWLRKERKDKDRKEENIKRMDKSLREGIGGEG